MERTEHIGTRALTAERSKLLRDYDTAVDQGADDAVKTEHGVSCEAHFRSFLEQFLPKKYGITKGYIITPDREYAGPLEEWDIIIYDKTEAPVLFVRRNLDDEISAGKRGIPVEFVRGVVEVKATLTKPMANKVAKKLLKLQQFRSPKDASSPSDRAHLPESFRSFAVFFETKVQGGKEYREALGALAPVWQGNLIAFSSALVIRGQTCPDCSAAITFAISDVENLAELLVASCEVSDPVPAMVHDPDPQLIVISAGYGRNQFWTYMIDMVHALNGHDLDVPGFYPTTLTGGYGQRSDEKENKRLFPLDAAV